MRRGLACREDDLFSVEGSEISGVLGGTAYKATLLPRGEIKWDDIPGNWGACSGTLDELPTYDYYSGCCGYFDSALTDQRHVCTKCCACGTWFLAYTLSGCGCCAFDCLPFKFPFCFLYLTSCEIAGPVKEFHKGEVLTSDKYKPALELARECGKEQQLSI